MQCLPFVLIVAALLAELCLIIPDQLGLLGSAVSALLFGLFSWPAYILPVVLVALAFYLRRLSAAKWKAVLVGICLIMLCVLLHAFAIHKGFSLSEFWRDGRDFVGGGVVGGVVGSLFMLMAKKVGTVIIAGAVLLLCVLLLFDLTPHNVWVRFRFYLQKKRRKALAEQKKAASGQRFRYRVRQAKPDESDPEDTEKINRVIAENERIIASLDRDRRSPKKQEKNGDAQEAQTAAPVARLGEEVSGKIDLDRIFSEEPDENFDAFEPFPGEEAEEDKPELTREPVGKAVADAPRVYVLPPLRLLNEPPKYNSDAGDEESRLKAIKLVKTLASFKVHTHISDIVRGPSVTRYELTPEEGVRVRSVANLVDDIALALATGGVRIEAPIPGKSAIGIEVPNQNRDTVYLRELIDNDLFRGAKSMLNAVLGKDVAGTPRYFDIAKMPHLLIAGTTGSGKSVCINSILMSLLYRATPDQLKLILIDPKKVEFNVYEGLPHLLVPVVSQPKKAAGTLNWACIEMERRYELIEEVGARNIDGYNAAVKDDPSAEYLPKIVIVIDELADLMMTARDNVEDAICRIAQKARAAGMHLIVGTQRPSVDVVTGLIKGNIPSRIALSVVSQVDSRTILDIGGAEKLIGNGDMLFAPIGASKPVRVQGTYVSEQEISAVVDFIKKQTGGVDYDQSVVESIEQEAERCTDKKKGGVDAGENGEDDPRLFDALEVAVDTGKISTSLLQRRLSVGYGKAAKLIDQMEAHGWVGPLEGSKPREIRITKQEYMEMALNRREDG